MSERRFFDHDPFSGVTEWFIFDHDSKKFHIETVQDVEPLLDRNKELASHDDRGWVGRDKWMRRVGSIPPVVQLLWLNEGIDIYKKEHWPAIARKLNDPEWAYLRTAPGRL